MKAMPLPFEELQRKGASKFSSLPSSSIDSLIQQQPQQPKWSSNKEEESCCYVGSSEPTSVLDTRRSPSPPTSSSTLSSSLGGGASTDTTTGVAAVSENPTQTSLDLSGSEKCVLGMEDWESVFAESVASPSQEQSILRLIMGEIEDPSMGLNKLLRSGNVSNQDLDFNAGFGVVDQGLAFEHSGNFGSTIDPIPMFPSSTNNLLIHQQQPQLMENLEMKPQIFNTQTIINQNQAQYPQDRAFFFPLSYGQLQEHQLLSPTPPKRLNSGILGPNCQVPKPPFSNSEQGIFLRRPQHRQLQSHPQRPAMAASATKQKMASDELATQHLQQVISDQIFKAAELIETGTNPALAQGILARLNHQLSLIGKPFHRAAFYFKDALQLSLQTNNSSNTSTATSNYSSPFSLVFKIEAYKAFSEISPILQFANFTCNQAILEALEGFDRIHILDFGAGYGEQWASLMQELALRNNGPPSLKITTFASPQTHNELELGFTQENLKHFAREIKMSFEFHVVSLESLNSASWSMPQGDAMAVNLPIGSFSNYPSLLPLVISFLKQLSPKIVVSLDRGCDRSDAPFPHHIVHALQCYSGLIESLEAVNVNLDALQKIERFLIHPGIEKIVLGRNRCPERTPPWKNFLLQSGFAPLTFSNLTESQAECLVQRTPARGFHVEKRQSSLGLCWQRKELISVSTWRC